MSHGRHAIGVGDASSRPGGPPHVVTTAGRG